MDSPNSTATIACVAGVGRGGRGDNTSEREEKQARVTATTVFGKTNRSTVFTRLNALPRLNFGSLTRRLFEIQSLLELFIHEAMDFLH